jgi:uncharacterized protein (UPF0548 family)
MISLSWTRPSSKQEASCLSRCREQSFNYDAKYEGATRDTPLLESCKQSLKKDGYFVNHAQVKIGSGHDAFLKGKQLLQNWGHFQLPWASVDANTPVIEGRKFCICSRELVAWIINPLQILYVDSKDSPFCPLSKAQSQTSAQQAAFAFGSGTLQGHLLAGEERFGIEWREDDSVWYEILSFSKPAHFLSAVGYPVVRFKQKLFTKQSTEKMVQAVANQASLPP